MKKYCLLSVLVLCLLLAGCGNDTLKCSYSSYNSYYGSDEVQANYTFKKDGTVKDYYIKETVEYTDKYFELSQSNIDSQYEDAVAYCKEGVPQNKNIVCKVYKNKNSITVNIDYKLSKLNADEVESLNLGEYLKSKKEDIEQQYSNQGFTCK